MTRNHDYATPSRGANDWHRPLNSNFEALDADVELRDGAASRGTYEPVAGAKFLATDTGAVWLGDGTRWGRTEYEDLKMERGAKKNDTTLSDWRNDVLDGKTEAARKNVAVTLLDDTGSAAARWEFTRAWPRSYSPPTLDAAAGEGTDATESVALSYDRMIRKK